MQLRALIHEGLDFKEISHDTEALQAHRVSNPSGPLPDCAFPLKLPGAPPSGDSRSPFEPSLPGTLCGSEPSRAAALLDAMLSLLLLGMGPLPESLSADPLEPMETFFFNALDPSEPPEVLRGATRTASASFICSH